MSSMRLMTPHAALVCGGRVLFVVAERQCSLSKNGLSAPDWFRELMEVPKPVLDVRVVTGGPMGASLTDWSRS